jgi:ribosomal protein L37E
MEARQDIQNLFAGRTAVLATKHGKETIIAPILGRELGITVIVPNDFDSDQFGTFTGERERVGSQLEAARAKARAAMAQTDIDLGIASEGSFSHDPLMPLLTVNREIVVLIDQKNGLEILGETYTTNTNAASARVSSADDAVHMAKQWGFPDHQVIVKSGSPLSMIIYKGLSDEAELRHRVIELLAQPLATGVILETDMRAHCNPTRQQQIARATEDLVKNARSVCPHCGTPGFRVKKRIAGAPCSVCGLPTARARAEQYACAKCDYTEEVLTPEQTIAPEECEQCNP